MVFKRRTFCRRKKGQRKHGDRRLVVIFSFIAPQPENSIPHLDSQFKPVSGDLELATAAYTPVVSWLSMDRFITDARIMRTMATTLWLCWLAASSSPAQEAREDDPLIFDKRLSQWTQLLHAESRVVRYRAARDLGNIGPQAHAAKPALTESLKDESESVREFATVALRRIGAQATDIPILIVALKDKTIGVQRAAAHALGELGHEAKAALPALKELKGPAFACAIVQIDSADQSGIRYLIEESNSQDYNTSSRTEAILALGSIGPQAKAALPGLRKALDDEGNDLFSIRMPAASAIARIDPSDETALPFLLASLEGGSLSGLAVFLLSQMGPESKKAVPALIKYLVANKEPLFTRASTANALGDIGPDAKAALPALRELLTDPKQHVREAAALAIYKIEQP